MSRRLIFLAILALTLAIGSARAQEYSAASWPNLMRTMVRFNALDLSDLALLDEYAIITDCDLYKAFFTNDFKWNQVRQAMRQSIQANIATFPTNYYYDIQMQLDRYDFTTKLFRFTDRSTVRGVNTLALYAVEGTGCGFADVKFIPRRFRAVLSAPLYLEGFPLNEKDAQELLARMDKNQNSHRIIFARYNLRTVYIEPLRKSMSHTGDATVTRYDQSNAISRNAVRLDAQLDSVGFYEDAERTKLIYQYQP